MLVVTGLSGLELSEFGRIGIARCSCLILISFYPSGEKNTFEEVVFATLAGGVFLALLFGLRRVF